MTLGPILWPGQAFCAAPGARFSAWVSLTKSALAWGPLSGAGLWDEKLTVAQVFWASSPAMAARDGLSPAGVEVTH